MAVFLDPVYEKIRFISSLFVSKVCVCNCEPFSGSLFFPRFSVLCIIMLFIKFNHNEFFFFLA